MAAGLNYPGHLAHWHQAAWHAVTLSPNVKECQ
jgi:hypothetical protein